MKIAYEISHLLAGIMLVASFALLYQQRIAAVLNAFAAQSITLALAVAGPPGRRTGRTCSSPRRSPSASREWSSRWRCTARWRGSAFTVRSRRWWASALPCWSGWR